MKAACFLPKETVVSRRSSLPQDPLPPRTEAQPHGCVAGDGLAFPKGASSLCGQCGALSSPLCLHCSHTTTQERYQAQPTPPSKPRQPRGHHGNVTGRTLEQLHSRADSDGILPAEDGLEH
ncbi:hypothetical protein NDU88_008326 [Pleurodeles waltl]|uniref:Uncharacterized protein n=1 Tax=Pleurodeles waltl TaxID=8319 RepID=A0AAV7PNV1_PLEWA|nr:hypothetical protein NDU88_008326 [Pleurodeles waltl]